MMPTLKIAASLAIFAMAGACHAQEVSLLMPMEKAAVVAAQTSSPNNYVLLEPIANKPVKRHLASIGMLEPMATNSSEKVIPSAAGDGKIVVTPTSFKRGIFDEHEFKVHNTSHQSLSEAKILLTAPVGSVVQQVSPKPDSVDGLSILVAIDQIAPGEHKLVSVAINYPRNEFAKFESMVITERWGQDPYVGTVADVANKQASVSILAPTELQPELTGMSTGMLGPKAPQQQTGMLKPKVPVVMASATTRRSVDEQDVGISVGADVTKGEELTTPNFEDPKNDSVVMSYFRGPAEVVAGQVNDYQIDIQNLSSEPVEEIIVQLSIPQNMKVTVLDRDAWYDAESRKISWKLDRVEGRVLETIRYKAVVKEAGSTEQLIVVGMDSKVQSTSSLKTTAR